MTTVTPTVLWAQRSNAEDASKNVIYMTIEVLDPINIKLDLTSSNLKLSADSLDNGTHYSLELEFLMKSILKTPIRILNQDIKST